MGERLIIYSYNLKLEILDNYCMTTRQHYVSEISLAKININIKCPSTCIALYKGCPNPYSLI